MLKRFFKATVILVTASLASQLFTSLGHTGAFIGSFNEMLFGLSVLIVIIFFRKELLEILDDMWNWIPLLLVIIYGLVNGYFAGQGQAEETELVWIFYMLLPPYLLYLMFMIICGGRKGFTSCLFVSYLFMFLTLIFHYASVAAAGVDLLDVGGERVSSERLGLLFNVNTVSYLAVMLTLITLRLSEVLREEFKVYVSIAHWLTLCIAGWVCAFNQSRGATLFLLFVVLWSGLKTFKRKQFSKNVAIILSLLLIAVIANAFIDIENISETEIVSRYANPQQNSDMNRKIMMKDSWDHFLDSPIFGSDSIVFMPGFRSTDHNFYTMFLSRYGVIGGALLALYVVSIVRGISLKSTSAQKFGAAFVLFYLFLAPPYPFLAIAFLITRYTDSEIGKRE